MVFFHHKICHKLINTTIFQIQKALINSQIFISKNFDNLTYVKVHKPYLAGFQHTYKHNSTYNHCNIFISLNRSQNFIRTYNLQNCIIQSYNNFIYIRLGQFLRNTQLYSTHIKTTELTITAIPVPFHKTNADHTDSYLK